MPIAEQSVRKPSRVYLRRGYPLAKNLAACWPFMEGRGSTVHDISGHQLHGTVSSLAGWDIGPIGPAIEISGAGANVSPPVPDVPGSTDRTFVVWAEHNDPGNNGAECYFEYGDDATGERWDFRLDGSEAGTGALRIEIQGNAYVSSLQPPASNEWFLAACVLEGDTLADHTLYLWDETNGLQSETASGTDSINTDTGADGECQLGDSSFFGQQFFGRMDLALFYSTGLPGDVIGALAERPLTPYITNPR